MGAQTVEGLSTGEDGLVRCWWGASDPDYRRYHDEEWGFPVGEDVRLFEKLCLEGFQAGLSWLTILRKREAFRAAFAGFEIERVAAFGARDVRRLLGDAGIVRHRGKIEAAINNAQRALELIEAEGSLGSYLWRFEPEPRSGPFDYASIAQTTTAPAAIALAKDLKRRGWRFVGPTTVYSFMQAMGLVEDHLDGCHAKPAAHAAREAFLRP